ncbi:unnamed protein product [Schistosoma margrebowiei]|uniref:Uncharacterized protein n=1 Tax=Schistosoma margrebowiei TaxID=48269 RepID=A0A3P8DJD7_9TREM|nr:unnamed protein product [Schistosoma margrebowiei]
MVWNQGFPTPLGGVSMSTNPVKAPDIRFSSSQFRKQHRHESGDQRLVHTPFVPSGYWSPCAPLIWSPVKAPDIRFSSSHFRKQHPRHEKAVSRTSLAEAIYA